MNTLGIRIAVIAATLTLAPQMVPAAAQDQAASRNQDTRLVAASQTGEEEPLKIGLVTSLTGAAAPSAHYTVNGIKLLLAQLHNHIGGRPVQLIVENDESNPATAMARVKKLIEEDKVDIIDGFVLANVGYKAAPLADQYKIPFVYTVAASDNLTQRDHFNWVVRTCWSSSQPTQPLGEWAYKKGYRRVVALGMDYAFGYEQVGGFQRAFEASGGKVVQKIWAPLGFADFSTYIKSMRKDADAVFICTFGKAAELFPKQYKEFGPKLPIVAGGSAFDESILPKLGLVDPVGSISALSYSAVLDTPANKKFVQAYTDYYGEGPNWYSECGYTSGLFIQKAVESLKGDTSDKTKLLAALKKIVLKDAPRGPVHLDNHANPIENVYIRRVDLVGKKLQNTVIQTYPDVSQFWKWPEAEFLKQPVYSKDYPPCKYCGPGKD